MSTRFGASQYDCDSLHCSLISDYSDRISRQKYIEQINLLWNMLDPTLLPGLQRRKDRRTLGEFALQIHDCTVRERFILDEWLKSIGREDVVIEDYGVGNDGRLILDPKQGGRPDYRIKSKNGEWKLEVKFCPVQYKLTFKIHDLKSYAREDALVLLIMGETKMMGPNGNIHDDKPLVIPKGLRWALFGRDPIRRMLKEIPIKPHAEVGGKPSVQIKGNQIENILKVKTWNYDKKVPQLVD